MLLLEAVRRGLKPLLLEKGDFCGKTSHNHLRTVHGGLRYLQSLNLCRFRDSIKERRWFLRYFPGFVNVLPCLMPLYNKGIYRKWIFRLGLPVNDLLSRDRNLLVSDDRHLPGSKVLSREETIELFPDVNQEGLKGGMAWYDGCLTEFQRFYLEVLKLADKLGAEALNYVEVTGLKQKDGKVTGVIGKDLETDKEFDFKARVVINATGSDSRDTAERFDTDYPRLFQERKRLWNVLFNRKALSSHALGIRSKDGFAYFFHTWKGRLLVGSPEKPVKKSKKETRVSKQRMEKFIADINDVVRGLDLKYEDILRVYPGILPAKPNKKKKLVGKCIFIKHRRKFSETGLYSISGVKFTTARLEADKALGKIFPKKEAISYDELLAKKEMNCLQLDYDWQPNGEKDLEFLKKLSFKIVLNIISILVC
jgi:glycerol-3-phosphate dehydrogenase